VLRHPEFRRGAAEMASISVGIGAWGLITGVAMTKAGLTLPVALLMSLTVFAGSAQLAVLPLFLTGAPLWVIWATAACVNLRFVILGTQWRPYFGGLPRGQRLRMAYFAADLNVVTFLRRFPDPRPHPDQWPYYWGGVAVNWCSWQAMSIAGIVLAHQVPEHWGFGFAGTLALLGLTCTLLHDRSTWLAAAVAGGAAVAAHALPLKLNIVLAIVAAVVVALVLDHAAPGRRAPAPIAGEDRT